MNQEHFKAELVAPCGMNCAVCVRYLAYVNGIPYQKGKISPCMGCQARGKSCFVKRGCEKLRRNELTSCRDCPYLPCTKIARLEKRYRERYATSFVNNLQEIRAKGMDEFLKSQRERFRCQTCKGVFSVHGGKCFTCGKINQAKPNFSENP